jgi:ADP-ribose pyrophosphatase YjhB (NUDIX family)
MKELPQVTIGKIKEDSPEVDWREDEGDDAEPTSAPTWLIQLLGFDPFQEEAEEGARADAAWDEAKHPRNEKGQFASIGSSGANPKAASGWVKTGGQLGTNPGGVYVDPANFNEPHYVKFYKNPDQGKGEALAGEVLKEMGIETTSPEVVDMNGKEGLAVKWNSNLDNAANGLQNPSQLDPAQQQTLAKMFAGAVLVNNWDVVGLAHDNIAVDKTTGSLIQMDLGGAFEFRAQGLPKDYDGKILSYFSMMDPKYAAGQTFGPLFAANPTLYATALGAVKDIDLDNVQWAFKQSGLPNAKKLFENFKERRLDLINRLQNELEDEGLNQFGEPIDEGDYDEGQEDLDSEFKEAEKVVTPAPAAAKPAKPLPSYEFVQAAKAYLQGSKNFKWIKNDPAKLAKHNANLATAKKLAPPGFFDELTAKAGKKLNTQALMSAAAKLKVTQIQPPQPAAVTGKIGEGVPAGGNLGGGGAKKPLGSDWQDPPAGTTNWMQNDNNTVFFKNTAMAGKSLNGVEFKTWVPPKNWATVDGMTLLDNETPLDTKGKKAGSGVVMIEGGSVWIHKPKNAYGGYNYTFPKGGKEPGLSLQANAIKETYEEQGLKAKITGIVGDFEGDTSVARFYMAERESGTPSDFGEETETVHLVSLLDAMSLLNKQRDKDILKAAVTQQAAMGNVSAAAMLNSAAFKTPTAGAQPGLAGSSLAAATAKPVVPVAPKPTRTLSSTIVSKANSANVPLAEIAQLKQFYSDSNIEANYISAALDAYPKVKKYGMTISELAGIKSYTGGGFRAINDALRGKDKHGGIKHMTTAHWAEVRKTVKGLRRLPKFVGTVKRGTDLPAHVIDHWKVGAVVLDRAFISSSKVQGWGGTHSFEINSIAGRDVKFLSSHPGENEVLFDPETRFEVLSIEKKMGVTHFKLQELPGYDED